MRCLGLAPNPTPQRADLQSVDAREVLLGLIAGLPGLDPILALLAGSVPAVALQNRKRSVLRVASASVRTA